MVWNWTDFLTGLAANTIATLVGVAGGIPLGLWLNRRAEENRTTAEAAQMRERQLSLLEALRDELQHNRDLLTQMHQEINESKVPFYSLDTDMWTLVGGEISHLFVSDRAFLSKLSRAYFEFEHIKRKVDAYFQLWADPLMTSSTDFEDRFIGLRSSLLVSLPPTQELCDEIMRLVDQAMEE